MCQPQWKLVAQLGDANPVDHGGHFVYVDKTGVYPPEAEILQPVEEEKEKWIVYRYALEPCTYGRVVNGKWQPLREYHPEGILSDNRFHKDHPAWFSDNLPRIAETMDTDVNELIGMFLSNDPVRRAFAWEDAANYHGAHELDHYPIEYSSRADVEKRYGLA